MLQASSQFVPEDFIIETWRSWIDHANKVAATYQDKDVIQKTFEQTKDI